MIGKIKVYHARLGEGVIMIDGEDGPREVYFHHRAINGFTMESVREGEAVEFDLIETETGPIAARMRKVSS